MASHGALKEVATQGPPVHRKPAKELSHIEMREAENGSVIAEHHFTAYEHKPEPHVFGDGEGHKLAAHIEHHLGISMPGKSKTENAEEKEGDEE